MQPKVLFDIGHPAHFHLFKNLMHYLNGQHIPFVITTRDKEVTNALVKHEGFDYISLTKPGGNNFLALGKELVKRDWGIYKLHRQYKFTHAFGTSVSIAHLSTVSRVKSYNFNEDDDDVVPLYTRLTYPFTTKIINPECIRFSKWKKKRILVPSYHELAYLHPNNFEPREKILQKYGLRKREYVIYRLSALGAHHDVGAKGISQELGVKIKTILKDYAVIESSEMKKTYQVEPWDMHHVMAFAKMIVSDSQTMTIEAAVMGVPAVRINTFIGKSTVIDELENKHQLCYGYFPDNHTSIIETIYNLATATDVEDLWQQRRERMLSEKIDLNEWMVGFFKDSMGGENVM